MHPCGEMKDRAHKAGTLALTSAPPLQTSFNLWEVDKFLSVFLAQASPDAVQFPVRINVNQGYGRMSSSVSSTEPAEEGIRCDE